MVYGLGSKGASLLRSRCDIPISRIDWSAKNRAVKRVFLNHMVMVSKIMCDIEATCGDTDDVELVSQPDLMNEAGRTSPFEWKVRVDGGKIGVVPDQTFAVRRKASPGDVRYFFLEADCGTMPILRSSRSRRSSIDRKLKGYYATWKQKLLHQMFGFNRFQVMIVSTGEERTARINDHLLRRVGTPGLFLVLNAEENPREPSGFLFSKS